VRNEKEVGGELSVRPPMAGRGPSEGDGIDDTIEGFTGSGLLMARRRLGELLVMGFCFKYLCRCL